MTCLMQLALSAHAQLMKFRKEDFSGCDNQWEEADAEEHVGEVFKCWSVEHVPLYPLEVP